MSHYILHYMEFVICQILAFAAVCDSLKLKILINGLIRYEVWQQCCWRFIACGMMLCHWVCRIRELASSGTSSPRIVLDWLNMKAVQQHHIPEPSVVILPCAATVIAQCCDSFGNEHHFSFVHAWCAAYWSCWEKELPLWSQLLFFSTVHPCFNTCYMFY